MSENAMNKKDFLKCISGAGDVSIPVAKQILDSIIAEMIETLVTGGKINFPDIGILKLKIRKARDCHNPKNPGEKVHKPEHQTVVFKPAKSLKKIMNS